MAKKGMPNYEHANHFCMKPTPFDLYQVTFSLQFFGGESLLVGICAWPPRALPYWSVAFEPDQIVGPLGGPFGPTAISKSRFRNFQG